MLVNFFEIDLLVVNCFFRSFPGVVTCAKQISSGKQSVAEFKRCIDEKRLLDHSMGCVFVVHSFMSSRLS